MGRRRPVPVLLLPGPRLLKGWILARRRKKYLKSIITHGHGLFSRGGVKNAQKMKYPKNSCREGVKFGVTEGGEGGEEIFSTTEDHTENFAPFLPPLGSRWVFDPQRGDIRPLSA